MAVAAAVAAVTTIAAAVADSYKPNHLQGFRTSVLRSFLLRLKTMCYLATLHNILADILTFLFINAIKELEDRFCIFVLKIKNHYKEELQ